MTKALGLVTAWNAGGDDTELAGDVLLSYIAEDEEPQLVFGLTNLAGVLLIRLSKATGKPTDEILREIALKYSPDR